MGKDYHNEIWQWWCRFVLITKICQRESLFTCFTCNYVQKVVHEAQWLGRSPWNPEIPGFKTRTTVGSGRLGMLKEECHRVGKRPPCELWKTTSTWYYVFFCFVFFFVFFFSSVTLISHNVVAQLTLIPYFLSLSTSNPVKIKNESWFRHIWGDRVILIVCWVRSPRDIFSMFRISKSFSTYTVELECQWGILQIKLNP